MFSTLGNLYPALCNGDVAASLLALFGGQLPPQHPIRADTQPSTQHKTSDKGVCQVRSPTKVFVGYESTRSRRHNTKHPTSGQRRPPVAATQEPTQHPTRADKAPDRSRRAKEEGQRDKGRCSTRQESPDRSRHAKSAQHPTRADMRNLHNTRQEPIPHRSPTQPQHKSRYSAPQEPIPHRSPVKGHPTGADARCRSNASPPSPSPPVLQNTAFTAAPYCRRIHGAIRLTSRRPGGRQPSPSPLVLQNPPPLHIASPPSSNVVTAAPYC